MSATPLWVRLRCYACGSVHTLPRGTGNCPSCRQKDSMEPVE